MDNIRLGKFTGKIYRNYEIKSMKECGVIVNEEQVANKEWIRKKQLSNLADCRKC